MITSSILDSPVVSPDGLPLVNGTNSFTKDEATCKSPVLHLTHFTGVELSTLIYFTSTEIHWLQGESSVPPNLVILNFSKELKDYVVPLLKPVKPFKNQLDLENLTKLNTESFSVLMKSWRLGYTCFHRKTTKCRYDWALRGAESRYIFKLGKSQDTRCLRTRLEVF